MISLDLELHWGVRDRIPLDSNERARLLSARAVVPRLLEAFEEFSVHATWAAVGILFARSRDQMALYSPWPRPHYSEARLDPYREPVGRDESDDPFHFAPGLIAQIAARSGQEIGTHSFAHFYCCEEGQGPNEFETDLQSAIAIGDQEGYRIDSYVFPRNQVRTDYLGILGAAGITCYRAAQASAVNAADSFRRQQRPHRRFIRLCDNYRDLLGTQTVPYPSGAAPRRIGASRYLRPYSEALHGLENVRLQRILGAMQAAAGQGGIFHLWWHPEDFARNSDRNMQFLRRVLAGFAHLRREFGMLSLSMREAARRHDRPLQTATITAGSGRF